MTTGRIAALTGRKTVDIRTYDLPPLERGAVLLAIRRANVCGSDVHQWHYESPALRQAGLGHEFVGEIVELGDGVDVDYAGQPVAVGDRVVPVYYLTCNRCPACLRSQFNLCQNGLASWSVPPDVAPHFRSGFATHYYVQPGQFFYKVPDEIDDATVAGANCGLAQMIFVLDRVGIEAGETMVIQGAGGLGLWAAAVARERGARVVVIDGVAERLELAGRFGADVTLDITELDTVEQRVAAVGELTDGSGADLIVEVTGIAAAFAEAVDLVRSGGRIASVGNLNAEAHVQLAPGIITRKSLTVQGVLRYDPWYLHAAVEFLRRRQNLHPFSELAGTTFALSDVTAALEASDNRTVARAAIIP